MAWNSYSNETDGMAGIGLECDSCGREVLYVSDLSLEQPAAEQRLLPDPIERPIPEDMTVVETGALRAAVVARAESLDWSVADTVRCDRCSRN